MNWIELFWSIVDGVNGVLCFVQSVFTTNQSLLSGPKRRRNAGVSAEPVRGTQALEFKKDSVKKYDKHKK